MRHVAQAPRPRRPQPATATATASGHGSAGPGPPTMNAVTAGTATNTIAEYRAWDVSALTSSAADRRSRTTDADLSRWSVP